MSKNFLPAVQYLRQHQPDFIEMLKQYVRFPSISTDPERSADMQRTAEWVADRLAEMGMNKVRIFPTARNPVVYAEHLEAGSSAPVVLIYGHYDVQPPDPLELWTTPPFEADVRGENIYRRGIADMKGQLVSCLAALQALQASGPLPVNLKFLVEGEEEISSPSLVRFVPEHKELLSCDFVLNLDAGMVSSDLPTITYGMRGICVFDVTITGPARDLHSGLFGGAVANPVQVLCKLVGDMRAEDGRIMLPGYYDKVRELSPEERADLNRTPMNDDYILQQTGSPKVWGEAGYTGAELTSIRPTLDVNGIYGGFSGTGVKTIIPAAATAKISMRLVPDQDPKDVAQQLRQFIQEHVPDTVQWEVKDIGSGSPVITDRNSVPVKKMELALEKVWGSKPLYIVLGGSVPVVGLFKQHLQVETVNTGFAVFSEAKVHSPDENLHLPTWFKGMEALALYFLSLA